MSYTAADGPPDLIATHAWAPATGTAPPVINNQATYPPTFPWIRIIGITGWRSLPESDDLREPRTYGSGEIVYPSMLLGKTLIYLLNIRALTVQSMQSYMTQLQRGFGDMSGEGVMTVTPYSAFGGGVVWTYHARVIGFDPDESWDYSVANPSPFTWGVSLTLRMSDPHFYTGGVAYL